MENERLLKDEEIIKVAGEGWQAFPKSVFTKISKAQDAKTSSLARADERKWIGEWLCSKKTSVFDWALSETAQRFIYLLESNEECQQIIKEMITKSGRRPEELVSKKKYKQIEEPLPPSGCDSYGSLE